MKHNIVKIVLTVLMVMIVKTVFANTGTLVDSTSGIHSETDKRVSADKVIADSTAIFIYEEGKLSLENDSAGRLFLYAEKDGNRETTYYLFTSRRYIHLGANTRASGDEYYRIHNAARWINVENGSGANATIFPMNDANGQKYRCITWKEGQKPQIHLSVNKDEQITEKTILLVVLPELDLTTDFNCEIKHKDTTMTLKGFEKIKLDYQSEHPLEGYTFVLKRPNRFVVDSILYEGRNIKGNKRDTPLKDGVWEKPLDSLLFSRNTEAIQFHIVYREFKQDTIVVQEKDIIIPLHVRKHGIGVLAIIGIVLGGVIVLVVLLLMLRRVKIRKQKKTHTGSDGTSSEPGGGKKIEDTDTTNPEELTRLKNENQKLKQQAQSLSDQLEGFKNDWNKDKVALEKRISELDQERIKATNRVTEVEKRASQEIAAITEASNAKIASMQAEVKALEHKAQNDIANATKRLTEERDEELAKFCRLTTRLKELLNQIPDEAIGNLGAILKSGMGSYYNRMNDIVSSGKSLKQSLDEMRQYSLGLLGMGSSCWIHSMGRLYSYLSVKILRKRFEFDGVKTDLLSEAYQTLAALLAKQGIVILNCSPGFDSNQDPMTNKLFKLDMQIDRITMWLDGSDNVRQAIPNHGNTIYDFGTLAYYTCDDTTIHQGSVIYYEE